MIRQQFDMDTMLPSPTPLATSFELPEEPIDIIMDYLEGEMSALYASTLVFENLPLLRSLVLSELDITNYGRDLDPKIMPFHALEELQISSCNINRNFPFLFRFLASIDSISRLQLIVTSDDLLLCPPTLDMTSDLIRDSASIALTHLSTFNIPLSVVHNLVAHTHTCNTLRVLWFDQERVEPGHISQIGAIFNVLGPSGCLKRVIFGPLDIFDGERYPYIKDDQQGWAALQLERCRALEEINLRIRKILRSHVRIFSHLPPSVHAVRITFVGMDTRVVAPETRREWNAFDAAFSEQKFRHIKLVLDMSRVKQTLSEGGYALLLNRAIDVLETVRAQDSVVSDGKPAELVGHPGVVSEDGVKGELVIGLWVEAGFRIITHSLASQIG
ncbi:hypothetical protein C8Q74DRAFT_1305645 [Fomes fomentarius]|nr:hypothetical protein C8Q74DRAFT_1305645 [Fomes fomentarius]